MSLVARGVQINEVILIISPEARLFILNEEHMYINKHSCFRAISDTKKYCFPKSIWTYIYWEMQRASQYGAVLWHFCCKVNESFATHSVLFLTDWTLAANVCPKLFCFITKGKIEWPLLKSVGPHWQRTTLCSLQQLFNIFELTWSLS